MKEYRKILLVDDSATSRMIMQRCLEMAGLRGVDFIEAENGLDALSTLKTDAAIDLIITDLNMPKMDGRAFSRMVCSDPLLKRKDLVVVSSIAAGDVEAELEALGVLSCIKKPLSPSKLLETLGGSHG